MLLRLFNKRELLSLALVVIVATIFPLVGGPFWITVLTLALFFAAFSSAWDLVFSYAGQAHFGPSLLVALGGYTAGILDNFFGWPVWVEVIIATLVAVLGGLALGLVALRLSGPFLGLVTIAGVLLMLNLVFLFAWITGGERGKVVPNTLVYSGLFNYYIAGALALGTVLACGLIIRSRVGLILAAIGQSVTEVEMVGISATRYKIYIFVFSAAVSGLGGALMVFYLGSMSAALLLELPVAITILMGAMLGGTGTMWGPAFGAILLAIFSELLHPIGESREAIITIIVWAVVVISQYGIFGLMRRRTA